MIKNVVDLPTKLQVYLLGDLRVLNEDRLILRQSQRRVSEID